MSNLHTPILDPVKPQYPFAQWSAKSVHEGKLLRRAEERDTTSRQVHKNMRLAAHPVESRIETTPMAWQPQDLTPHHQDKVEASMAGSETTRPNSVEGSTLAITQQISDLPEVKDIVGS